jgi:hypothetical protein
MKKIAIILFCMLFLTACDGSGGSGSYQSNPTWEPPSDTYQQQSGDLDCSDFSSQSEAQRVYNQNSYDIHRLDRDGDGIACDILP